MTISIKKFTDFRKIIILATPLILGTLEIWHPVGIAGKNAFESISPQADWWLTLHILQLPLFGLMALAVFFLTTNLKETTGTVSRIGLALFIVFYTALDSIMGIAGGILIRTAQDFPTKTQNFVAQQVNTLIFNPIVGGGTFSPVAVLGAGGWLIALISCAIGLMQIGIDFLAATCLVLSGILFAFSHTPPTGPLGLLFFFLAVSRIDSKIYTKHSTKE